MEHKQSSQEEEYAVVYGGEGSLNNVDWENIYTENEVPVDVIKIEKDSDPVKYLPGAVFTLRQLVEDDTTVSYVTDDDDEVISTDSDPTGDDGKITFDGLKHGYYEITESVRPAGYIMDENLAIYFKIEAGTVTYLKREEGKAPAEGGSESSGETISFSSQQTAAFTVSNTPGKPLPHTGGPGTRMYLIFGLILLLGGGMLLIRRSRRSEVSS